MIDFRKALIGFTGKKIALMTEGDSLCPGAGLYFAIITPAIAAEILTSLALNLLDGNRPFEMF